MKVGTFVLENWGKYFKNEKTKYKKLSKKYQKLKKG